MTPDVDADLELARVDRVGADARSVWVELRDAGRLVVLRGLSRPATERARAILDAELAERPAR